MKNKYQYKELESIAKKNNINFDNREIISWMDNINILYKVFKLLLTNDNEENYIKELINTLHIIAEYKIPFYNNRIDYLLAKDNKILILEFSFANKKSRTERFQDKLNQVMNYKELLYGILPNHLKISTYTFVITPEKDENWNDIENHLNEEITILSNFIFNYFKNTNQTAIEELEKIKNNY